MRNAALALFAVLLMLGAAGSRGQEAGNEGAANPEHTWYAQALARGAAGLNVTHFWSRGSMLRAETVVAGHKIVTIVNGPWYYAYDGLTGARSRHQARAARGGEGPPGPTPLRQRVRSAGRPGRRADPRGRPGGTQGRRVPRDRPARQARALGHARRAAPAAAPRDLRPTHRTAPLHGLSQLAERAVGAVGLLRARLPTSRSTASSSRST